jgi:hypothetical protein
MVVEEINRDPPKNIESPKENLRSSIQDNLKEDHS